MNNFEYGDQEVGMKDMAITLTSMIIGVGILTLPRLLAKSTQASDGWISILIAGILSLVFAWMVGKLAVQCHKEGFFAFTASLVTKPVSLIITSTISIYYLLYVPMKLERSETFLSNICLNALLLNMRLWHFC